MEEQHWRRGSRSDHTLLIIIGLALSVPTLAGYDHKREELTTAEVIRTCCSVPDRPMRSTLLTLVQMLPIDAPPSAITEQANALIAAMGKSAKRDRPLVLQGVEELAVRNGAVEGLTAAYRALPKAQYTRRLLLVQLLGALRRPDAVPSLLEIATAPLPVQAARAEGLGPAEREEIVQGKAVEGLQYVRDAQGRNVGSVDTRTIQLINSHPSRYVRSVAIDAYMWNHGDTPEAAETLKAAIPGDLRRFIGRPRFHQGANRALFEEQLARVGNSP